MNILEEYKDLYYKELEFADKLNSKITTCITFITILGSAQALLWTQFKHFQLCWYTGIYYAICCVSTTLFGICVYQFVKTYCGYPIDRFPIKSHATQIADVLNRVSSEQREDAHIMLEGLMAKSFIESAVHNRKQNVIKNNRHIKLIKLLILTFIITFVAFSTNIMIDYYESRLHENDDDLTINEIYIEGRQ